VLPPRHQQAVINAGYHDTIRTIIFTGRPLRVLRNEYILNWESRPEEIKKLTSRGIIPVTHDMETAAAENREVSPETMLAARPLLMGKVAGAINDIKPAKDIVDEMVEGAAAVLRSSYSLVQGAKL
jgi:NAD(P)H-dependent flavin oxidoreductase YrpB (nitropropane dioxygenase family)